jgi:Tol biopolymer transport system component
VVRGVFRFALVITVAILLAGVSARAIGRLRPVTFSALVSDATGITEIYEMGVESPSCNTSQPTYSVFCGVNLDITIGDLVNGMGVNVGRRSAAHPVWSAQGQLAWQSLRDSNWEIYVWDTLSADLINVSHHQDQDTMPAVSADGQLAWMSQRDGDGGEIYVWDAFRQEAVNVTRHPSADRSPVWTQDAHLTWVSDREGRWKVYVFVQDQTSGDIMKVCEDQQVYLDPLPTLRLDEIPVCPTAATTINRRNN